MKARKVTIFPKGYRHQRAPNEHQARFRRRKLLKTNGRNPLDASLRGWCVGVMGVMGRPVCSRSSKARRMLSGTRSLGLSTKVLPQAIAYGRNQKGIIAGKLKGAMAATTPRGWRMSNSSVASSCACRTNPYDRRAVGALLYPYSFPPVTGNSPRFENLTEQYRGRVHFLISRVPHATPGPPYGDSGGR